MTVHVQLLSAFIRKADMWAGPFKEIPNIRFTQSCTQRPLNPTDGIHQNGSEFFFIFIRTPFPR